MALLCSRWRRLSITICRSKPVLTTASNVSGSTCDRHQTKVNLTGFQEFQRFRHISLSNSQVNAAVLLARSFNFEQVEKVAKIGRQKMVLERGTNYKLSRRTCSVWYGLQSCRGNSAGVAKRPRELIEISHPKFAPSAPLSACPAAARRGSAAATWRTTSAGGSPGW